MLTTLLSRLPARPPWHHFWIKAIKTKSHSASRWSVSIRQCSPPTLVLCPGRKVQPQPFAPQIGPSHSDATSSQVPVPPPHLGVEGLPPGLSRSRRGRPHAKPSRRRVDAALPGTGLQALPLWIEAGGLVRPALELSMPEGLAGGLSPFFKEVFGQAFCEPHRRAVMPAFPEAAGGPRRSPPDVQPAPSATFGKTVSRRR